MAFGGLSNPRFCVLLSPALTLYPCYTAEAARMLCRYGLTNHPAIERTREYLLNNSHNLGGWRCNFSKLGRSPETEFANPGATLYALDVLRWFPDLNHGNPFADQAVDFLLGHWESRAPLGPCQWGIGTLFMQVEYPFLRYNLFFYVYVLSFFPAALQDSRFTDALQTLQSKLREGQIVVERPHRALKGLEFCMKGMPSAAATVRYDEIIRNLSA